MSAKLLEDFLELEPFAAEVKRNPRTVLRWISQPDGLPYTKLGKTLLFHVPTARDWLMSRMNNVASKRPRTRKRSEGRNRR